MQTTEGNSTGGETSYSSFTVIDDICGPGTEYVEGVCQVVKTEKTKTVGDDAPFFGIFVYLDNLLSWIFGK